MAAPTITDSVIATGTGTSVTTGNLSIAAGDVVYVGIVLSAGSPGDMSSVTSSGGGGAFSSIADSGVVQSFQRLHIWRSTSPSSGTVTITATPSASTSEIAVIAVSVAGVDSGTPNGSVGFTDGNGTGDATSASVSSGTDALVLDFHGRFTTPPPDIVAGAGQTQLEQANYASVLTSASSTKAGASSVTTTWERNGASTVSNWQWVLGALSINGASGNTITPGVGALTLTGHTPRQDRGITASAGALVVVGHQPSMSFSTGITPSTGVLAVTGYAPTVVAAIVPGPGVLTVTGHAPTQTLTLPSPAPGVLTLVGHAPTVSTGAGINISPSTGALTLTGYAPAQDRGITAVAGVLVVAGHAPSMSVGIAPSPGVLVVAGHAPRLDAGITPGTGQIVVTGHAPAINGSASITAQTGALVVAGHAPSLAYSSIEISPECGQIVVSGWAPTVSTSGQVVIDTHDGDPKRQKAHKKRQEARREALEAAFGHDPSEPISPATASTSAEKALTSVNATEVEDDDAEVFALLAQIEDQTLGELLDELSRQIRSIRPRRVRGGEGRGDRR